jgi:hypothetical protein
VTTGWIFQGIEYYSGKPMVQVYTPEHVTLELSFKEFRDRFGVSPRRLRGGAHLTLQTPKPPRARKPSALAQHLESLLPHPVEQAGLGPAPYKYKSGCSGWPHKACGLCGTPRNMLWVFVAADGREFALDGTCLSKFIEGKQDNAIATALSQHELGTGYEVGEHRDWIRKHARIERAQELLERPELKASLQAKPHPYPHRARLGETAYDSFVYRLKEYGMAPKMRAAKEIEKLAGVGPRADKLVREVRGLLK